MKTVEQCWLDYKLRCYGDKPLLAIQKKETMQAFYSGYLVALGEVGNAADTLSEDNACDELSKRVNEIQAWFDKTRPRA